MLISGILFSLAMQTFTMAAEAAPAASAPQVLTKAVCEQGVVDRGNAARIDRAMAKARRGEHVVVGVIGGSITEGGASSGVEHRWANLVAQWWREHFPKAQIELVNAALGATGSDIGSGRVGPVLLSHAPDFVVVEYGVNDSGKPNVRETFEGVIRQILTSSSQPGVMILYTMHDSGANEQDKQAPIGKHYGIPMVSFRDAAWPEIQAGHFPITAVLADQVHPNDLGHSYCAQLVDYMLAEILAQLPPDDQLPALPPVPAPLYTDVYAHTALYSSANEEPASNKGWKAVDTPYMGPGWESDTPGSELEFDVSGSIVALIYQHKKADMGRVEAWIDDGKPVEFDGYFKDDWGTGYARFGIVSEGLAPGPHKLHIRLLDTRDDASKGNLFRICGVLCAGVPPKAS